MELREQNLFKESRYDVAQRRKKKKNVMRSNDSRKSLGEDYSTGWSI